MYARAHACPPACVPGRATRANETTLYAKQLPCRYAADIDATAAAITSAAASYPAVAALAATAAVCSSISSLYNNPSIHDHVSCAWILQDQVNKIQILSKYRAQLLHVFIPAPHTEFWQNATGVPTGFLPFVGVSIPQPHNYSGLPYVYDVAFTGAMDEPSVRERCPPNVTAVCEGHLKCPMFTRRITHYPALRRSMACSLSELRAEGLRVARGLVDDYELLVATTKIVPATTESSHLGPRILTVLASARALLICDDDPKAYKHLGLVNGVHAVLVSNKSEFIAKVMYYADPGHEAERLRIVHAAAHLMKQAPLRGHADVAFSKIRTLLQVHRRGSDHNRSQNIVNATMQP